MLPGLKLGLPGGGGPAPVSPVNVHTPASVETDEVALIEDLSYRYRNDAAFALQEVNLRIRRSEFLAVMGPTGSGKTTLCLTFNGIIPHFYGGEFFGSVRVSRLDTVTHPTHELAEGVGMVFQDPEIQLTAPTVIGEIAFGLENIRTPSEEIRSRARHALKAVRLDGLEEKHPHQLSGGQKQRLAIAAALALQLRLLVLDEPTSQLDPVGTAEVFAVVRELNRLHGITVVLASHAAEEIAESADRVILLVGGKVILDAPPSDFFQHVDLLLAHGVRPPGVTQAFHRVFAMNSWSSVCPVTLRDARGIFAQLQPHLSFHALTSADSAGTSAKDAVLETRDLRYVYADGTEALRGVSLQVRRGEYVAIAGQNGAGKSTLVRHFLHLLQPTSGEVFVFGQDVTGFEVSDLARRVGYVSQNPDNQIFCDSVEREVAFALKTLGFPKEEIRARVEDALREMRLEWATDRHPLTLSKADRSRVVVAAILAMHPEILIFDEPTTGQDYRGALAILDLTRDLHRSGRTIIVITHHLYLLPGYAQRLVVLGKGVVLLDAPLRDAFYQTHTLRETFLKPPQLVEFAERLGLSDKKGFRPITVDEFASMFQVSSG